MNAKMDITKFIVIKVITILHRINMYMYVCIYIHMLVRLDDYCKTVKLLQFS